ncbi:hypothetical protein [Dyadobacter frigoris]|uniref:hypothetical protein n=1 Tax=Dyadobacter frigoris TaxID=2576211 RepID=UPI001485357F|nr:hypothetical protein [Dyadobacter frigoris]GLU53482.1 hypothetical protein Dfri01_29430 [Dyadobacter frigoris]
MPTTITKNQQRASRKSTKAVAKYVEGGISNIERKTREMERILDEFPIPLRTQK